MSTNDKPEVLSPDEKRVSEWQRIAADNRREADEAKAALRQFAFDVYVALGEDTDGAKTPDQLFNPMTKIDSEAAWVLRLVKANREEWEAESEKLGDKIRRATEDADDLLATQDVNHEEDNYAAGQVHAADSIRNILVSLEVEK